MWIFKILIVSLFSAHLVFYAQINSSAVVYCKTRFMLIRCRFASVLTVRKFIVRRKFALRGSDFVLLTEREEEVASLIKRGEDERILNLTQFGRNSFENDDYWLYVTMDSKLSASRLSKHFQFDNMYNSLLEDFHFMII